MRPADVAKWLDRVLTEYREALQGWRLFNAPPPNLVNCIQQHDEVFSFKALAAAVRVETALELKKAEPALEPRNDKKKRKERESGRKEKGTKAPRADPQATKGGAKAKGSAWDLSKRPDFSKEDLTKFWEVNAKYPDHCKFFLSRKCNQGGKDKCHNGKHEVPAGWADALSAIGITFVPAP